MKKNVLIVGVSGAGKSTLAKAVRKAKGESQDTISQAEFLSINNLPIELTEEEMSAIDSLSLNHSEIIDHNQPSVVEFILGFKVTND